VKNKKSSTHRNTCVCGYERSYACNINFYIKKILYNILVQSVIFRTYIYFNTFVFSITSIRIGIFKYGPLYIVNALRNLVCFSFSTVISIIPICFC
jgi:hypothetical protein